MARLEQQASGADEAEALVRRLCRDHGDALYAWAVGRMGDRRDAEEVVAETIVRAWRRHDQFDPERGSERSWVFGIVRNTAVDHHRRGRRHLQAVPDAGQLAEVAVEGEIERVAEATVVRDVLRTLSDDHRQVVVLAYFEGMRISEIAGRVGIPPGTVKSRLYYAMRALRSGLEEQGVLR